MPTYFELEKNYQEILDIATKTIDYKAGNLPIQDREDIVQTVAMKLWINRFTFDNELSQPKTYINTALVRQVIDKVRSNDSWDEVVDPHADVSMQHALPDRALTPDQLVEAGWIDAGLDLNNPDPGEQFPLLRMVIAGFSSGELKDMSNKNPATVRSDLHRERKKLKKMLNE